MRVLSALGDAVRLALDCLVSHHFGRQLHELFKLLFRSQDGRASYICLAWFGYEHIADERPSLSSF